MRTKKILLVKFYGLPIRFLICYWDSWVLDLPCESLYAFNLLDLISFEKSIWIVMCFFQGIDMKCSNWYNELCKTVRPGWLFGGVPFVSVKLCGYCLWLWLIVPIVFNHIVYICPFLNGIPGPHEKPINVSQNPSKSKYRTHSFAKKKLQQILCSIRAALFC